MQTIEDITTVTTTLPTTTLRIKEPLGYPVGMGEFGIHSADFHVAFSISS